MMQDKLAAEKGGTLRENKIQVSYERKKQTTGPLTRVAQNLLLIISFS